MLSIDQKLQYLQVWDVAPIPGYLRYFIDVLVVNQASHM